MLLPKIKVQSNFCIDNENNIKKIDVHIINNHIEINNIKDDEPLSNYINEDLILNLLGHIIQIISFHIKILINIRKKHKKILKNAEGDHSRCSPQ